eukprot:11280375-Alexandrium_andersonii.AAC.1
MDLAEEQINHNRGFVFEHPLRASSWLHARVKRICNRPRMFKAVFDQCVYGLVSKQTRTPIQKPTAFLANMTDVSAAFHQQTCRGCVRHQRIEGQEGGGHRAAHAPILVASIPKA